MKNLILIFVLMTTITTGFAQTFKRQSDLLTDAVGCVSQPDTILERDKCIPLMAPYHKHDVMTMSFNKHFLSMNTKEYEYNNTIYYVIIVPCIEHTINDSSQSSVSLEDFEYFEVKQYFIFTKDAYNKLFDLDSTNHENPNRIPFTYVKQRKNLKTLDSEYLKLTLSHASKLEGIFEIYRIKDVVRFNWVDYYTPFEQMKYECYNSLFTQDLYFECSNNEWNKLLIKFD